MELALTRARRADPSTLAADLVVVTVPNPPALAGPAAAVDALVGGAVTRSVEDAEVTGRAGEVVVFHGAGTEGPRRIAVVGVGEGRPEDWRAAGTAAGRRAVELRAATAAVALPDGVDGAAAAAFAEGVGQGAHRDDRFRGARADDEPPRTTLGRLIVAGGAARDRDLRRAERVMAAVAAARELADTPANLLTPSDLAVRAETLAADTPAMSAEILEPKALRKLGAGALLAVAQGSDEPARMIVLRYRPAKAARRGGVLGLVGKAVTFDSGGLSIKPASGMEEMKLDMAGGAAVINGIVLVARLGLPLETLAVVPATENLPSGHAVRPGDVVTAMNGKTIEVLNTDAEGRLILADGLTYAARSGATRLLDLATLTGGIVVALGGVYSGLFGSDPDWTELVRQAGEESGDLAWPMPLHPGYAPLFRSRVADFANSSSKREATAVYAAQFLREFTEGVPWCHVDIAGTAMRDGRATGAGVPLIGAVAERLARGRR
jgi:leucyl aminopeptidase